MSVRNQKRLQLNENSVYFTTLLYTVPRVVFQQVHFIDCEGIKGRWNFANFQRIKGHFKPLPTTFMYTYTIKVAPFGSKIDFA